jgi:hypothetical protein
MLVDPCDLEIWARTDDTVLPVNARRPDCSESQTCAGIKNDDPTAKQTAIVTPVRLVTILAHMLSTANDPY